MKLFLNKLWWLCLTLVGYGIICFMLELPMTTVVYSLLKREDPQTLTVATFAVGFIVIVYMIYLKRLRNDAKRREYLTDIRRRYGGLKEDCRYTAKTKEFRAEVLTFATGGLIGCGIWCAIPFQAGQTDKLLLAIWILLCLLIWSAIVLVVSAGRLLIHNRVHRAWVDGLIVPELTEEAQELQLKHRAIKRNLLIQFLFCFSFYVIWALNHYLVTFSVVVTPALFLYCHIQSLIGLLHMRDLDEPYRWYARLHCIALVFYLFSFTFGIFSPK